MLVCFFHAKCSDCCSWFSGYIDTIDLPAFSIIMHAVCQSCFGLSGTTERYPVKMPILCSPLAVKAAIWYERASVHLASILLQLGKMVLINPLIATLKPHSNGPSYSNTVYTGCWCVGCYIWCSEKGAGWGCSPPRPPLTVPNVTAHPSTVYRLHIIWCGTISASGLWRVNMNLVISLFGLVRNC